ncbi:SLC13 family permease [Insolitispirillum peregrinum]|uniref:SLC13 family permease n=1 Tax=Insolitispirillum peregrinum TaxID=80876 RepID=UPI00360A56E9
MTASQLTICAILLLTLLCFAWGRWRHDLVAMTALLTAVLAGLVPTEAAFSGFANPAVISVAAVLVIGRTLGNSGLLDRATLWLDRLPGGTTALLALTCGCGGLVSTMLNNAGALALLLPATLAVANRRGLSPSLLLIPLSFATLLGGMVTLIGTPPNLVIAQMIRHSGGQTLEVFDLAVVGGPIAVVGIAYLVLVGWHHLPERMPPAEPSGGAGLGRYHSEVVISAGGPLDGLSLPRLEHRHPVRVHGVVRDGLHLFGRREGWICQAGDVLLLDAEASVLDTLLATGAVRFSPVRLAGEPEEVCEMTLPPQSLALGSTADSLHLQQRFAVSLLAISRQGQRFEGSLSQMRLGAGDVLMLSGSAPALNKVSEDLGLLRLAPRDPAVRPRHPLWATACFALAVLASTLHLTTPSMALMAAVVAMVLIGALDLPSLYRRIDWSVLVLLAALIPLGDAFANTGAADWLAHGLASLPLSQTPYGLLALALLLAIAITPILNNVATVLMLGPIVISLAEAGHISPTPLLVAVAIGASTDFLTPFGHHNNTIVMGLGGYQFRDYSRAGWPLTLIVFGLSLWLIPLAFPF